VPLARSVSQRVSERSLSLHPSCIEPSTASVASAEMVCVHQDNDIGEEHMWISAKDALVVMEQFHRMNRTIKPRLSYIVGLLGLLLSIPSISCSSTSTWQIVRTCAKIRGDVTNESCIRTVQQRLSFLRYRLAIVICTRANHHIITSEPATILSHLYR
jgi:hypothetical protein